MLMCSAVVLVTSVLRDLVLKVTSVSVLSYASYTGDVTGLQDVKAVSRFKLARVYSHEMGRVLPPWKS